MSQYTTYKGHCDVHWNTAAAELYFFIITFFKLNIESIIKIKKIKISKVDKYPSNFWKNTVK